MQTAAGLRRTSASPRPRMRPQAPRFRYTLTCTAPVRGTNIATIQVNGTSQTYTIPNFVGTVGNLSVGIFDNYAGYTVTIPSITVNGRTFNSNNRLSSILVPTATPKLQRSPALPASSIIKPAHTRALLRISPSTTAKPRTTITTARLHPARQPCSKRWAACRRCRPGAPTIPTRGPLATQLSPRCIPMARRPRPARRLRASNSRSAAAASRRPSTWPPRFHTTMRAGSPQKVPTPRMSTMPPQI